MRILVISDSHKNSFVIDKILSRHTDVRHVFFLGDNVSDIEDFEFMYPSINFYKVAGNCDFGSLVQNTGLEKIDSVNILYTHGHIFDVKYSLSRLKEKAKNTTSKIVLYGHTHVASILYEDGIYFVNPGSCSRPRDGKKPSYAVIDIEKNGIMPIIVEI